jgi:hypothetical protein
VNSIIRSIRRGSDQSRYIVADLSRCTISPELARVGAQIVLKRYREDATNVWLIGKGMNERMRR